MEACGGLTMFPPETSREDAETLKQSCQELPGLETGPASQATDIPVGPFALSTLF
jgi:hypothetical protein